jgi:hypothetical protein
LPSCSQGLYEWCQQGDPLASEPPVRNHRGNDDTISWGVTKSLHNNPSIPLEKRGVKSVCVINKFLKVSICNLGREGKAQQILEEAIKTVGPEVNDYVVLLGCIL